MAHVDRMCVSVCVVRGAIQELIVCVCVCASLRFFSEGVEQKKKKNPHPKIVLGCLKVGR